MCWLVVTGDAHAQGNSKLYLGWNWSILGGKAIRWVDTECRGYNDLYGDTNNLRRKLVEDSMHVLLHHATPNIGNADSLQDDLSAVWWIEHSGGTYAISRPAFHDPVLGQPVEPGWIYIYSSAERRKYEAEKEPASEDTLLHEYFWSRADTSVAKSVDLDGDGVNDHLDIAADTAHPAPDSILWHCAYPAGGWNEPRSLYCDGCEIYNVPFDVAIKLQVANVAGAGHTSDSLVLVRLREDEYARDARSGAAWDTTLVLTWGALHTAATDTVIFLPTFHLPHRTWHGNNTFVEMDVRACRRTRIKLDWIALEDSAAHSLLAGNDLDPSNDSLRARAQVCTARIDTEVARLTRFFRRHDGNNASWPYAYLSDEPQIAPISGETWPRCGSNRDLSIKNARGDKWR
jgi:hypothetical protein